MRTTSAGSGPDPGPAPHKGSARRQPRYPIESVENALTLLLLLRERDSIGVVEAADRLSVAPSTAHRLLAMLQHHRLVQQEPTLRTYVPGPALVELGLAAIRDIDVRVQIRPSLEQIVAEVEETAHLVVRRGASIVYLDCVECRWAVRAGSRTGDMLPAHCTAAGKALLAELDDQTVNELYAGERLLPMTGRSITSKKALMREVAGVRRLGYGSNSGESEEGLSAVAMAVKDGKGLVLGAITVAGPTFRIPEARFPDIASAIGSRARAIAESVSGRPHPASRLP